MAWCDVTADHVNIISSVIALVRQVVQLSMTQQHESQHIPSQPSVHDDTFAMNAEGE